MNEVWEQGCKAAWEWYGTPAPQNPYLPGSQNAIDWDNGFDQGEDDYYEAWKVGEV